MGCKICNSNKTALYHNFSFFPVIICNSCGTLFAKEPPKSERLKEIYNEEYYKAWKGTAKQLTDETRKMKILTFSMYLKLLSNYATLKGKNLLDIGCATGYLLEAAKKMGCNCYGVEISPFGAKESSKIFPGKIYQGTLEKARFKDARFDIITMTDLIEHVVDPVVFMEEAKRILKPNGLILLVTPNFYSWWSKILGKKWTNFKEEHLFYFSPQSLKVLADISGLKIIFEKPVSKFLSLDYIYSQFSAFPTPVLFHISRLFPLFPSAIRSKPFPIGTGDYLQILRKVT